MLGMSLLTLLRPSVGNYCNMHCLSSFFVDWCYGEAGCFTSGFRGYLLTVEEWCILAALCPMPAAGKAFCFTWHTAFCPATPGLTISSPPGWVMHAHPCSDQALQPWQPAPPPGEMGTISFSPSSSSVASEVTLCDLVAHLVFKIVESLNLQLTSHGMVPWSSGLFAVHIPALPSRTWYQRALDPVFAFCPSL